MKKVLLMVLASILTVGLMACGDSENNESESGLSASEIYEKSFTEMEDMESATMTINLDQDIEVPEEDMDITMTMAMDGDVIMDPMQMHQTMDISMGGDGLGALAQDTTMEFYLTEDAFYVQADENGDEWMKMSPEELGMVDGMLDQQEDPTEQLELIEEYVDDLNVEEDGDSYVLNLTADADGFDKLIEETLGDSMADDMLGADFDMSEDIDIHKLTYEMVIDKDSYLLTSFTMDMDLSITIDGETADLKQTMDASYDNINEIDSIEVPQDIIDNAVEQPGM